MIIGRAEPLRPAENAGTGSVRIEKPRFEYKALDLSGAFANEIQDELNRLAREGWQLIHVNQATHYLERPFRPGPWREPPDKSLKEELDEMLK